MMNKKAAELSITMMIMAILSLLVIVIWSFIFFPQKFNPEKDVCIDYECTYVNLLGKESPSFRVSQIQDFIIDNFTDKSKCPLTNGKICNGDPYNNSCVPNPLRNERCIDWRPKNVCDTNPNNETCVCDEDFGARWNDAIQCAHICSLDYLKSNFTINSSKCMLDCFEVNLNCTKAHMWGVQ